MIDIIIVNYNSTDHLIKCLASFYKDIERFAATVYVQDNASTDHVERLQALYPRVKLHKNTTNQGFGKAVNQALRQCTGDYVILLNPDAYTAEGFFDIVIDFMNSRPDVGIMGPKILDHDGKLQNSARAFPNPLTAIFGRSSYLSRRFPQNPITSRNLLSLKCDGKTPMTVDWVSGACMVVRKKAIAQIGMLDERFFMYWEDTDWCRRMWAAGWKVVYFPEAVVYHYVGGSSEKRVTRSVLEFHKSVYRLFDKYLPPFLGFTKPLAFGCLSFRFVLVMCFHLIKNLSATSKTEVPLQKTPPAQQTKKIKILRIISRLNIGGPAIHVYLLTTGLDDEIFESKLVTGSISPREGDMSYLLKPKDPQPIIIPELQREIQIIADIKSFYRIFRMISLEKPDIVHTHTAKAGTSARLAVFNHNLFGKHRILTVHTFHGHVFEGYFGHFTSMLFRNIERMLANLTDAIIAISQSQKKELIEKYRIGNDQKIRVIELGFELSPFLSIDHHRGQFRNQAGIPEDALLIGIVGRLVLIKNHKMFLSAAKCLMELNPGMTVRFVIIGDGELGLMLQAYAEALDIGAHVHFCGWVKDIPMVYADLDVLALTSNNEGTPVSMIEAMAASVPVISTDAGGVGDLLGKVLRRRGKSGFAVCERGILCQTRDAAGFAEGLDYLISEDTAARRERVAAARRYVEAHFGKERLIQDIESLYESLLSHGR